MSRDTWDGNVNRPLSLNRWMYVEGNPINQTDPTGLTPLRQGYVEGFSTAAGLGDGDIDGSEIVYDYATMTRARFRYTGKVGGLFASIGAAVYVGSIIGFDYEPFPQGLNHELPYSQKIISDYKGDFDGIYAGKGLGETFVGAGVGYFHSPDGRIKGGFSYLSAGIGLMPFEIVGFHTTYGVDAGSLPGYNHSGIEYYYDTKTGNVNRGKLLSDILSGDHSPILGRAVLNLTGWVGGSRNNQISIALIAARKFEKYYYRPVWECRSGQPEPQPVPPLPDPFQIPLP